MSGGVWVGDDPEDLRRARPKPSRLEMPRAMRRADLVCPDAGQRPSVIAIVYPRDVAADRLAVLIEHGEPTFGSDFAVTCRCGRTHAIDGGKLRVAVLGNPVRSGRAPALLVRSVERTER